MHLIRIIFIVLIFNIGLTSCHSQKWIKANHSEIVYWGRVDHSKPKSPSFSYPGVTIKAQFTGTSIKAWIESIDVGHKNYFYVIIDDNDPIKIEILPEEQIYLLGSNLKDTSHTIELIKLTESFVGKVKFKGFLLDSKRKIEPLKTQETKEIEFIGNSISCGYGNEVSLNSNPNTGFHAINENNYKAWGYITARNLGLKYTCNSYSGKGIYRNYGGDTTETIPLIYDRIFPDDTFSIKYDFEKTHPDIIVLNLGTNDFAKDPNIILPKGKFQKAYKDFLMRLKNYHPNTTIICAVGTLMSDNYPEGAQHLTKIRTYINEVIDSLNGTESKKIYYFEMEPQSAPYGEDWHPSSATHERMASELTTFIRDNNLNR